MRGEVKVIYTGSKVREAALKGAKQVYDIIAAGYGPTSGNVALEKPWGPYVLSHDGVSIVRDVVLPDKREDVGAGLLIEASKKSNDIAGDGTTASAILGYLIMEEAMKKTAAGFNPMELRRGIDKAALAIKELVSKESTPVKDEDLKDIASISASDSEVGALIADTVLKVNGRGIAIDDHPGLGVIQDIIEGFFFEKGLSDAHFITDRGTQQTVQHSVHVLVVDKRITTNQDIVPLLGVALKNQIKRLVIIGNISATALETCIANDGDVNLDMRIMVIHPPVYGDQTSEFMEDIALFTDGKVVNQSTPYENIDGSYFGEADQLIANMSQTTLLGGRGSKESMDERIKLVEEQLKSKDFNANQKEKMEIRLTKLQGKVGIIRVGGATPSDVVEMKFRVEDAVHATRAAREEGIVPGGGTTLARISQIAEVQGDTEGEREGFKAVINALSGPFKQLMKNAGESPDGRLAQLLSSDKGLGFNLRNMTTEPIDLIKEGVVDPTKVVRSVVENACSVAGLMITLNGAVLIKATKEVKDV